MSFFRKLTKYKYPLGLSIVFTILATILYIIFEIQFNNSFDFLHFIGKQKFTIIIFFILSFILFNALINRYINNVINRVLEEISPESYFSEIQSDKVGFDQLSQELLKKTQSRTTEINVLKDKDTYRKEFLGNISHELKTPLFTIQGYILTLMDGALKDKNVRDKYLKRAAKGVDRIINIVLDLDLITQFESGIKIVDKKKFDIVEVVQNVFDLLEIESQNSRISLVFDKEYSSPVYVNADEERILQVLTNLLVNSLKYGLEGGRTEIAIQELENQKVLIRVMDTGEGIEKHHLPRLFERFYRVDPTRSRKKGGSGLGLSIVKHIIEAHNENIYVESEVGRGTTFSFTLDRL